MFARNWLRKSFRAEITKKARDIIQKDERVENFETRIERKDGSYRIISWHSNNLMGEYGNIIGSIAVGADITERKQTEEELRQREASYRLLVENAGEAIAVVQDEVIKLANPMPVQLSGFSQEGLSTTPFLELVHPEDRERTIEKYQEGLSGKAIKPEKAIRLKTADGFYRWVDFNWVFIEWEGRPAVLGFIRDVTEGKIVEDALRESEQKYRQLFEASPISLWEQDFSAVKRRVDEIKNQGITDLRSFLLERPKLVKELAGLVQVVDVNQATLNLYNARSKEDFYSGITKVFAEESYEDFIEAPLAIAERRTDLVLERVHVTFEGEPLRVQLYWSVAPGYEDTYSRVLVSIVDVTSQKKFAEQLKHQLQFEQMVSDISSYLVALPPEQVDRGINYLLERIGRFFQIDRSYLFRFSDDNKTMSQTHEWCVEGVAPQMENTQNVPVDSLPWWAEKINISEEILTKKEPLSAEEWKTMKKHPEIGYRITLSTGEFSHVADDILAHHERWDGAGYPRGLKGKEIPLLARIAAIADAYEVMANGRPYRKPLAKTDIVAEFREGAGKQFDPELVEIFLDILKEETF